MCLRPGVFLIGLLFILCVPCGVSDEPFSAPFMPVEHTVVLYHFDEGQGDETRDACGDPA